MSSRSSESDQERNEHEDSVPRGSGDKKRKRQDYETPKKQYHSSPESEERNEHEESVPRGSAGSGDKKRKRQDYETPETRPNHHNASPKQYSNKSSNSGRSTIKTSEQHPPSAGEESKRRRRVSFPSPSEETSGWAKLMTAHFELLETQIGTLTRTMKDFRSAFNNQQGIPSTDKD